MRGRGQIAALARVAEPDVGVITNIHPVHLELLGTLEDIAEAKAELLAGLGPAGVAVVPADCSLLRSIRGSAACRVVRFGFGVGWSGAWGRRRWAEADVRRGSACSPSRRSLRWRGGQPDGTVVLLCAGLRVKPS